MATPTRPEITAYSSTHLVEAAAAWNGIAENWETHFKQILDMHPVEWKGNGALSSYQLILNDYRATLHHADYLRGAATYATHAADTMAAHRQSLLHETARIEEQGFVVDTTWNVTPPFTLDPAKALELEQQAIQHQAYLQGKATKFMASSTEVGAQMDKHAVVLTNFHPGSSHAGIQAVDCTSEDDAMAGLLAAMGSGAAIGALTTAETGPGAVGGAIAGGLTGGIGYLITQILKGDGVCK